MRSQNSNDVFHVTLSKWKVWAYVILCWLLACIPLLPIVLFTGGMLSGRNTSLSEVGLVLLICGPMFLLFASIGVLFLRKLNKPVASLTRTGFSGIKNLKVHSFRWTPNTVIYRAKNSVVLANLDSVQSRASKLWSGPKAAVIVHYGLTKQNRRDVVDAIHRLSPFSVKETTMWGAAKH